MSYILDALRKADAQRERNPARGIHAQPATALPPDQDPDAPSRLGWLGAALAGAALLALTLWWFARSDSPVEAPPFSPVATSPAAGAVVPTPSPTLPAPATEVLPAAPPMSPPIRPVPAPPPAVLPPVPVPFPPGEALGRAPTPPAAPQPAGATGERLPSVAELPAEVQRDLPKLTITGGVYSNDPAQRLLIVNGQVLNEGADAAPGVVLTQIRPKTAVLTFRGWRYGVAY